MLEGSGKRKPKVLSKTDIINFLKVIPNTNGHRQIRSFKIGYTR